MVSNRASSAVCAVLSQCLPVTLESPHQGFITKEIGNPFRLWHVGDCTYVYFIHPKPLLMPRRYLNRLTATQVKTLTKPGKYADGNGLSLQITDRNQANGRRIRGKSWLLRYQQAGRAKSMGLWMPCLWQRHENVLKSAPPFMLSN